MPYLWADRHQPLSEADLVVQKKKVGEVREFLTLGIRSGRRILILRGPPGSGKASVLKALCHDIGYEVVEWSPTSRKAFKSTEGVSESLAEAFLRFLAQADRYRSLQDSIVPDPQRSMPSRPHIALVRDFPFTLVASFEGDAKNAPQFLERFRALVRSQAMQRTVFCFNDTRDDHRVVTRLFSGLDFRSLTTVAFDTVPRTFVQKALENVANAEGLSTNTVDLLAMSTECGGDLRHAINALQLTIGSMPRSISNTSRTVARGRSKVQLEVESTKPVEAGSRQQAMGLFHAIGRLLWCKRIPPTPLDELQGTLSSDTLGAVSENGSNGSTKKRRKKSPGSSVAEPQQLPYELLMPKATRPPLYYVPEEVVAASCTEPSMLINWLFTNAPRFYGAVDDLASFAASVAEVDAWSSGGSSSSWRRRDEVDFSGTGLEELATSVQVRSLLDANLHPVPPSFGDPTAFESSKSEAFGGSNFNMVRPLMWDVSRHRNRRMEDLATQLAALDPSALGSLAATSSNLVQCTLPFVHLILCASRGNHPRLRTLPHQLMQLTMDLNRPIDSDIFRTGVIEAEGSSRSLLRSDSVASAEPAALPSSWGPAPADDPIEDF